MGRVFVLYVLRRRGEEEEEDSLLQKLLEWVYQNIVIGFTRPTSIKFFDKFLCRLEPFEVGVTRFYVKEGLCMSVATKKRSFAVLVQIT